MLIFWVHSSLAALQRSVLKVIPPAGCLFNCYRAVQLVSSVTTLLKSKALNADHVHHNHNITSEYKKCHCLTFYETDGCPVLGVKSYTCPSPEKNTDGHRCCLNYGLVFCLTCLWLVKVSDIYYYQDYNFICSFAKRIFSGVGCCWSWITGKLITA